MAKPAVILSVDAAGFTLSGTHTPPSVPWHAVGLVLAFKRDLYVVDQISVAVQYGSPASVVELDESMDGFQAFCDALEAHLPGSTPWAQWYLSVAFPAFETRTLCIFRRDGAPDAVPECTPADETKAAEPAPAWLRCSRTADRVLERILSSLWLLMHGVQYVVLSPVFLTMWLVRRIAAREGSKRQGPGAAA